MYIENRKNITTQVRAQNEIYFVGVFQGEFETKQAPCWAPFVTGAMGTPYTSLEGALAATAHL